MCLPLGAKIGCSFEWPSSGSNFCTCPVRTVSMQMLNGAVLPHVNAMSLPSGDHEGRAQPLPQGSASCPVPSACITYSRGEPCPVRSDMKTICDPFGDHTGFCS